MPVTQNSDGSFIVSDKDGNSVRLWLAQDPSGADRVQLISQGFTGSPSPFVECEIAGARTSARFIDVGGSADMLTQGATIPNPQAGFPEWAG